ncbi:hypothetical protein EUX98_g4594 [Antrodiella citrinella]|uniref:Cytosine-specific methyltransferase n=1 Tax=Antrodiella citrinella TaxID=2447956 RepID=A0A4S4MUH4_9APHY|nr:hypothetical protein EUX98_g4594 [Antrodiella citrinella]
MVSVSSKFDAIRRRKTSSWWCGSPVRYRTRSKETLKAGFIGKHPRPAARKVRRGSETSSGRGEENDWDDGEQAASGDEQEVLDNGDMLMDEEHQSNSSRTVVGQECENLASAQIYVPELDETPETYDLEVYGELLPEEDNSPEYVPVRVLSDFTVYRLDGNEMVSFHDLYCAGDGPHGIGASGIVAAWIDDGEDLGVVEDDDELVVALTDILEVDVNYVSEAGEEDTLDSKIYIRTEFAWYILDVPSASYAPLFAEFWRRHHLFHLVVSSSLDDPELDVIQFQDLLVQDMNGEAEKVTGQTVSVADFVDDNTQAFIVQSLKDLFAESNQLHSVLENVPLLVHLLSNEGMRPMQVTGKVPLNLEQIQEGPPVTTIHTSNHGDVQWDEETEMGSGHYQSVRIDGVLYKIGDSVIIVPGEDTNDTRMKNAQMVESTSTNHLVNTKWFAKICYFFEEEGRKLFHAQWYQPGSQILLQETAHSQALFLMNECDDLDLDCIYQKCNLRVLEPSDEEPLPNLAYDDNDFFTGLSWDQDDSCFMEITPEQHQAAIKACEPLRPCYSCGVKKLEEEAAKWLPLPDGGMSHVDHAYHQGDFVYVRPSLSFHGLYEVAQIVEFYKDEEEWFVHLRLFARYSLLAKDSTKEGVVADDRRLYLTSKMLYARPLEVIDDRIFVIHPSTVSHSELEKWVEHDDHYYADLLCDSPDPDSLDELTPLSAKILKPCPDCLAEHSAALEEQASLLAEHGPLRGLELFAGAGGLSTGFNFSGFVKTKWAVEFEPVIALTHGANHKNTVVYNQCSNALLAHAILSFEGKKPSPLTSLNKADPKELPSMPMPGEVDFIFGGPPCQSFSGMNHNKKADDMRSTMPANMLSYVEFYRPQYFLLENVKGMVYHTLSQQQQQKNGGEKYSVRMGVIKFILRYQARFKLLQAGQYGAPQGRLRVIFWGARRDLPLPKFPVPTHFFSEPTQNINLPHGDVLKPPTRVSWVNGSDDGSDDPKIHHQCAPMPSVTSMDAISDLPAFDWINPHEVLRKTAADARETAGRRAHGIAQVSAINDRTSCAGYENAVAYARKPANRYQLFMRRQMGDRGRVKYHYSAKFSALMVERVTNIPMEPKANHELLPPELSMPSKKGSGYKSVLGRIDGDGHFRTALTKVNPGAKGGSVLHPTQKRIVTVRECARSQGFPDHYQFLSLQNSTSGQINDQLKQIGNAVPIPLGLALGKELGKALYTMWRAQEGVEERERAASPEIEMYDSDAY